MEITINNTLFIGKFLIYLPSVDSTNNYAKDYITKSSPIDGTVIFADEQFAGRGQTNNVWQSQAGKNLTFSIICQCKFLLATQQFLLSMAISVGIAETLEAILPNNEIKIKWPNDILINDKKICGILIENTISGMHLNYAIIGIGLNINQKNFGNLTTATSLNLVCKETFDRNALLEKVLFYIEKYFLLLKENRFDKIKTAYLNKLYRYNEMAYYKKDDIVFEGKIIDVAESGKLIMQLRDAVNQFDFKEISFT